ncbi:MAG: hypothetical protein FK733_03255 [Asgard group archaeon]|nr:hypothetical protein [Asgard group archaeon]
MSFGSVLLGALVGGAISSGALIGITFLGTLVPWWALLLIAVGGTFIGGIIGGLLARGAGAGFLAGILSGLIVTLALFLFAWLYYKQVILDWFTSLGGDITATIENLVAAIGMDPSTGVGAQIVQTIVDKYNDHGADINAFANAYFPVFGLIIGAIFGGLAAIINAFAGLIGGAITKKKPDDYDSYY